MKLSAVNLPALDQVFAERVAKLHSWWPEEANFTRSANKVVPFLDKNLVFIKKEDGVWCVGVDGWTTIHYGKSTSFPHAAVIALLRAEGVEVAE